MRDYTVEYADGVISVLYYDYQHIGVGIVAKGVTAVAENPPGTAEGSDNGAGAVVSEPLASGTGGANGESGRALVSPIALPSGFRRLGDLRKRAVKQSYDDLLAWVGKTIRLDGVNFKTEQKGDKTVIVSGVMSFSEFDPSNPDKEVAEDKTVTTAIPRGAIRALYAGLQANPDETIVCDVVKGKRGLALQ